MGKVEERRMRKSFRLSIPFWSWASLILTVGGIGYLPKNWWIHYGAFIAGVGTPLLVWWLGGAYSYVPALGVIAVSSGLAWVALHWLHAHGVERDHDASAIVIDEVAGGAIVALALPLMVQWLAYDAWMSFVGAFLCGWVFRLFDLKKPYPADIVDTAWHHPFAVMADDMLAGVYGLVSVLVFAYVLSVVF